MATTELKKGSDEDIAIQAVAKFSGQYNGINGRITKMLKQAYIEGAVWMRERLENQTTNL